MSSAPIYATVVVLGFSRPLLALLYSWLYIYGSVPRCLQCRSCLLYRFPSQRYDLRALRSLQVRTLELSPPLIALFHLLTLMSSSSYALRCCSDVNGHSCGGRCRGFRHRDMDGRARSWRSKEGHSKACSTMWCPGASRAKFRKIEALSNQILAWELVFRMRHTVQLSQELRCGWGLIAIGGWYGVIL